MGKLSFAGSKSSEKLTTTKSRKRKSKMFKKENPTPSTAIGPTVKIVKKKKKNWDRYFNSHLSPGQVQHDDLKNDSTKKLGSSSGGYIKRNRTAPSKPKRLNKGPFQGKNKNRGDESNVNFRGKGTDGLEFEAVEEQSRETRNRITSFKKSKAKSSEHSHKMVVKPGGKWFENSDEGSNESNSATKSTHAKSDRDIPREEMEGIQKSALDLYNQDCWAYKNVCTQGNQKADFQWMEKMMRVGTLPDRMAAFVVKIQDSPIHNLQHLQTLLSMVKVQSKQQCIMSADTLKDLFLEDLLPPDRKLIAFEKRGPSLSVASRAHLIKWIYEDHLKICYKTFIEALRKMSLDTVDKIRAKAIFIIHTLLTTHPEREAELLQMLVNKLGDPINKVASRALFYLNLLLRAHPRMKLIVIEEVERLMFRNNIGKKAQYYGICFLNMINLEDEHPEVACKLLKVYIAFFKGCVKTGDIESRLMSALLTGVNKSYPSAKEFGFKFAENTDTLYKITHLSNFHVAVQALSILFELTDVNGRPEEASRFYRVLYSQLQDPAFGTTSHILPFLNLIFKSMKCDNKINRVRGFSKRLLQICQDVQPHLTCAILVMLSEISKTHPGMFNLGKYPLIEQSLEPTDLSDDNEEELEQNQKNQEKMATLMKISNVRVDDEEPSGSQIAEPVNSKRDSLSKIHTDRRENKKEEKGIISVVNLETSDIICDDIEQEVKVEYKPNISEYDPTARNPEYCGAEFSLAYEVVTLSNHFHPSVALYADTLLRRKHIASDGNPLKDFTISKFLERFVYRNSKKPKDAPGRPRAYQPKGLRSIPVNSAEYLRNTEDNIPVEERFFYRYFKEKQASTPKDADDASDAESVGDDEFDQLMANYFKSVKGNVFAGDDEEEDDFDFAADIHKTPTNKGKNKNKEDEDDGDDDEMDISDGEDDGPADDADEMIDLDDLDDDDDGFEEEDGLEVFEEEDGLEVFEDFDVPQTKQKMGKKGKNVDMFAPAEQFAEMLEANAEDGLSGPSTLINRDKADRKQLQWETDRDRWMKGYKRQSKNQFKSKRRHKK